MKTKDKAWLAGVIDKGSYIGIPRHKNSHILQFKIQTTDIKLVAQIMRVCGCGKYITLPGKRGNNYYVLYFGPVDAASILIDVAPYIKVKNKHINIALRFRETFNDDSYTKRHPHKVLQKALNIRDGYRKQLAKLATRGPISSLL